MNLSLEKVSQKDRDKFSLLLGEFLHQNNPTLPLHLILVPSDSLLGKVLLHSLAMNRNDIHQI